MTTLAQTRRIHALRRAIPHYTDEDWRAYLNREYGVASSKDIDETQARRAIWMLETLAGENGRVRRGAQLAEGPYAGKLRALWISLYCLGAVDKRDDKAMTAFVERQTGLSHTAFLRDWKDARKAVEALKSMLARHCDAQGVTLPAADKSDGMIETKRAVAKAVASRAVQAGAFDLATTFRQEWPSAFERWAYGCGGYPASFEFYTGRDWDEFTRRLATRTRAHLAKAKGKKRKAA